ncbi:MAG: restriction endonuclease [Bradyrhizobium sp.]|uniref:restriction endonuclease n=1 Tax=Bradyrhizobium sp. TaxID=376 RepID=UPI001DA2A41F|nr:restriction endonuclease [Bradyrhizobium sp.]MBV9559012.1 restriction endonuclease [Bradyrhizobium sp.]
MAPRPFFRELEEIVAEIFRLHGFDVETNIQIAGLEADLLVASTQGKRAVVEVKSYSSRTMGLSALVRAAHQLIATKHVFRAQHAILAVSASLSVTETDAIKSAHPGLLVYDVNALTFLAVRDAELYQRLDEFLRRSQPFSNPARIIPTNVDPNFDLDQPAMQERPIPTQTLKAKELEESLRNVPPGDGKAYENAATEALTYALSDHFATWLSQHGSETRMSIYDLIARISSDHDFWNTIITQFHSRYVIFEFKNYTDKIGQGQIYTTEKYLYKTALRGTAIIVSPMGPDENAIAAAKGALREHGKLIISLTTDQLIEMLDLKDSGGEPTDVIVAVVDDMLMTLER